MRLRPAARRGRAGVLQQSLQRAPMSEPEPEIQLHDNNQKLHPDD